jgi:succinyl-CoA synthetase alpha subunit
MRDDIPGLLPKNLRLLVQGITGKEGSFHTKMMLDYGTNIVAGVTPGKGGSYIHGVPVYDTIAEAVEESEANSSIIFVPARFAYDAAMEAIYNRLSPIVIITEGIPAHDTVKLVNAAAKYNVRVIGPNTPGLIFPNKYKIGILPDRYFDEGAVAVVSRSGTLTYEISMSMVNRGFGQRIVIGCGGDYIIGTNFIDILEILRRDLETKAIVVIGEIGGDDEERLADYIMHTNYPKPVVAYVAGRSAPPGKRMGHAGAIISGGMGSAESKINKFKEAGVRIAYRPSEVVEKLMEVI